MKHPHTVELRVATLRDAPALADIYRHYVENTTITFESAAPDGAEFARRIGDKLQTYPFLIATEGDTVVGYAYASRLRERPAYNWVAELSVYLRHDLHRNGIGRRLYSALLELLTLQGVAAVYGCITCPNEPSVRLHESMGFTFTGCFHAAGFKHGGWHDVLWYEKRIGTPETPAPLTPFPLLDRTAVDGVLRHN